MADGEEESATTQDIEDLNDSIDEEAADGGDGEDGTEGTDDTPTAAPSPMDQVVGALKDLAARFDAFASKPAVGNASPPVVVPAASASPPAQPAAPQPDVAAALATLTKAVTDLGAAMKTQGQRLAQIEKRTGSPASLPVGERSRTTRVSWPIDLNRPMGRGDVQKDVSFHDIEESAE